MAKVGVQKTSALVRSILKQKPHHLSARACFPSTEPFHVPAHPLTLHFEFKFPDESLPPSFTSACGKVEWEIGMRPSARVVACYSPT